MRDERGGEGGRKGARDDSAFKPSVAELAGRFRGHAIPSPTSTDDGSKETSVLSEAEQPERRQRRRIRKACDLSPNPFKVKIKSGSIIEKLQ
ncbi:hypothetical protein CRUP_033512, partial [Coryphaenoides rupestris]